MPTEATAAVGIVVNIGPYDPKSQEWSTYKGILTFYLEANIITSAERKRATLLTLIGPTAYRMLADLHRPAELSTVTFDALVADLDSAYGKKVSKLASKVRFQSCRQHEGQSVDEYLAELRHAAIDCEFGTQLDSRLKEQFVVGLRADNIKKRLLEDEDKALAEIVKKARDLELVNRETSSSKPATASASSTFSSNQVRSGTSVPRFALRGTTPASRAQYQQSSNMDPCYRCGRSGHVPDKCDYFTQNRECLNCHVHGHKASVCFRSHPPRGSGSAPRFSRGTPNAYRGNVRSFNSSQPSRGYSRSFRGFSHRGGSTAAKQTHYSEEEDENTSSVLTVHSIQNVPPIIYTVEVNGIPIDMEVDSGSCFSMLNSDWWRRLGQPVLRRGPSLRDVSRNLIPVKGIGNVEVQLKWQRKQLRVVFLDRPDTASLL